MATKTKLKYRAVRGYNPKTRGTIVRPAIAERETYYTDQVVEYCLKNGYVRGQFHDMRGALNGFIEGIQVLGESGVDVDLNAWLRVHGELTGTLDETLQLTDKNKFHVCITALKDLKHDVDEFSWTRVDDGGVQIKVESLTSPGGTKGEITKTKAIVANGKNLSFNAAWGDSVKVSWLEDGETKEIALTPSEVAETYLRFDWPTALADVEAGTELTFSFRYHGSEGGAEQSCTLTVKIIAAA